MLAQDILLILIYYSQMFNQINIFELNFYFLDLPKKTIELKYESRIKSLFCMKNIIERKHNLKHTQFM